MAHLILTQGNFTEPQARHVIWQVLAALEYMHVSLEANDLLSVVY